MQAKRWTGVCVVVMLWVSTLSALAQAQEPTRPIGVVNLNTASVDQLMLLPGIGAKRAGRILRFRQVKPFKRVVELARVRGIGLKTVRKLRIYLAVEGPTTLSRRPPKPS